MQLLYFDHHDGHGHLWSCLDERFARIPEDWDDDLDFARRVDAFFSQGMAACEPPVLLVFHVSEIRTQRETYFLNQEIYQGWPRHQQIYTVLVTGGEAPVDELEKHNLPETHFFPYSLKTIGEDWPDAERDAWQRFILDLEQQGRADWTLLQARS